ncbi:MAG: hypothetical protein KDB22_04960 [Planctomycetales bacterium]|nr:hypothetical protein [Planctomycetales bacterium]
MMKNANWLLLVVCFFAVGCGPPAPAPLTDESDTAIEAQKAVAGVGKRGQSLNNETGVGKIIAGPAKTLLNFEQKAVLEFQIPQALQLYKATNGYFPKTHEEFMKQIVEANRLKLPELPEGAVYQFDPEKGELWVYPESEVPQE